MKESKFIEIIGSLSKEELYRLGDFLNSKIFNTNRKIILLYDFLKRNNSRLSTGNISREKIYRSVFRNDEFNETKYWKLTSAFSSILEKFLVYTEFERDIYYRDNLLLENYRKRNLHRQFSVLADNISSKYTKEFNRSMNYFVNQTHFYFQKVSYLGNNPTEIRTGDIELLFENLRMFFITTHLASMCIISNFNRDFIINCRNNLWFFDEMLVYMNKKKNHIKKNYITAYIFCLILYTRLYPDDESYYVELKKLVLKNLSKFSGNLLRTILVNILYYAGNKLDEGDEKYLREIFIINKIMAENSLTFFGEFISEEYFYSVVEHAAELYETEWISKFIEKYRIYLREGSRDSVVNLAMAKACFAEKKYNRSLEHLLNVNNINPYFYIAHKILLLQNYFEIHEPRIIKQVLETLTKYQKRRKDIPPPVAVNCTKFLEYFKHIPKLKNGYDSNIVLEKLKKEKYFINKPWLVEKISLISSS